jgi:HNH endonuclease
MSLSHVSQALRDKVAQQARHRCGCCLTSAAIVGMPMEIDHLIPEALGGETDEESLWLAGPLCNGHKADRIAFMDAVTGEVIRLFDPRRQVWSQHLAWTADGVFIVGLTPAGRATVAGLNMNRVTLVLARQMWVKVGWHPPKD